MDCRTVRSLINKYVNNSLTMDELEQFLDHVEGCPSCYDELETYFIVYYAMKRLDNDRDGTFDMNKLMKEDIRRRRRRVRRYRMQELVLVLLIVLFGGGVVVELLKTLGIFLM